MKVHIDKVTDVKTDQKGTSCKIHQGGDFWYANEDATPLVGKDIEIEETEKTSAKGNKYKIAKVVKVLEGGAGGNSHSNSVIPWEAYAQMAGLAHNLAKSLEPDDAPEGNFDRAISRAAILNTVMIAFSNGKIALPGEDEIPF